VREPKQARPNVLVIEADDMRWDDLRWMPNVRRLLQRRGLTFENSFAPYPLCCPSRASFLTGEYAHNHHVYSTQDPFGFASFHDRRTIATVLQKAGYRTALVGKYLNGYGQQPLRSTGGSSLHYEPPGWTQWLAGSDHVWQPWETYGGNTYDYFHLAENVHKPRRCCWARRGSAGGPELPLTPQLRGAAHELVAAARFGRPGRIWSAAASGG